MAQYLIWDESPDTSKEEMITKQETTHSEAFDLDILEDKLKHIYSKSFIRRKLAYILAIFYKYPTLIIIFSFILGFIFFGLPLILIYFKTYKNFMVGFCIMLLLTLVLCVLIFLIRIIDDAKNKINMAAKWERKNFVNFIGLILTFILWIISAFLLKDFFEEVIDYNINGKLKLVYEPEEDRIDDEDYININDFVLKFTINSFLLNATEINNEETNVANYISDSSILKNLINNLCKCFIPLFIFIFNKLIQTIIIEVKYTFPKIIIFLSSCCFSLLIMIMSHLYNEKQKNKIVALLEMVFIIFFFTGYFAWCFSSTWTIFKKPKDKNFAINKYDLTQLILIYFFDFINIIGTSFIFISILISYINFINKNETFYDLELVLLLLKIGFLMVIISNSFYYGHNFLALIFRPISLQYAPVKLKENYVRANRNQSSYIFIS